MVRFGGNAAIAGGIFSILIFAVYALTRVGAAGDRQFGSLDGVLFVTPGLLTLALWGLRARYRGETPRWGRRGLDLAVLASALIAIGSFGGNWLAFPRSGNYLIGPGSALLQLCLIVFALDAFRARLSPRLGPALVLSLGVLPAAAIVMSQIVALLTGTLLLHINDWYFRGVYGASGALWLLLGVVLRSSVQGGPDAQSDPVLRRVE